MSCWDSRAASLVARSLPVSLRAGSFVPSSAFSACLTSTKVVSDNSWPDAREHKLENRMTAKSCLIDCVFCDIRQV